MEEKGILRRLFERLKAILTKRGDINLTRVVDELSSSIDLEILQNPNLLESLKSARVLEIKLEHWKRFYNLRRYEVAAELEEKRVKRKIHEAYIA